MSEIDEKSVINIKIEFKNIIFIDKINELITKNVIPIIIKIFNKITLQNIKTFETINDTNIEIININYFIMLDKIFNNKFNSLLNFKNCSTMFLTPLSKKSLKKNELQFKYKRVSNYLQMNDITGFIVEKIKENTSALEIIGLLKSNFGVPNIEEAKQLFENAIQSLDVMYNMFDNKKLKIKGSPGFNVLIQQTKTNNIIIDIFNIDNLLYLDNINKILSSLLLIELELKENIGIIPSYIDIKSCLKSSSHNKSKESVFIKDKVEEYDDIKKIITQEVELDDVFDVMSNSDSGENLLDILLDNEDESSNESEKDISSDNDFDDDKKYLEDEKIDLEDSLYDKKEFDLEENLKEDEKDDIKSEESDNVNKSEISESTIISSRNPIYSKLLEHQYDIFKRRKKLFTQEENNLFKQYTRACPTQRQPILLTQEEKDEFDANNGTYDTTDILEYTNNPDNKYYYVCPRFWSIDKKIFLTKEQAESGKYGTIMNIKKNIPGNIISRDNQSGYQEQIPGFLEHTTPEGFCMPCCFNKKPLKKHADTAINKRILKCKQKLGKLLNKNDIIDEISSESSDEESYSIQETSKKYIL